MIVGRRTDGEGLIGDREPGSELIGKLLDPAAHDPGASSVGAA